MKCGKMQVCGEESHICPRCASGVLKTSENTLCLALVKVEHARDILLGGKSVSLEVFCIQVPKKRIVAL